MLHLLFNFCTSGREETKKKGIFLDRDGLFLFFQEQVEAEISKKNPQACKEPKEQDDCSNIGPSHETRPNVFSFYTPGYDIYETDSCSLRDAEDAQPESTLSDREAVGILTEVSSALQKLTCIQHNADMKSGLVERTRSQDTVETSSITEAATSNSFSEEEESTAWDEASVCTLESLLLLNYQSITSPINQEKECESKTVIPETPQNVTENLLECAKTESSDDVDTLYKTDSEYTEKKEDSLYKAESEYNTSSASNVDICSSEVEDGSLFYKAETDYSAISASTESISSSEEEESFMTDSMYSVASASTLVSWTLPTYNSVQDENSLFQDEESLASACTTTDDNDTILKMEYSLDSSIEDDDEDSVFGGLALADLTTFDSTFDDFDEKSFIQFMKSHEDLGCLCGGIMDSDSSSVLYAEVEELTGERNFLKAYEQWKTTAED